MLLAILLVVVYLLADRISRPLREFSAGIERISLDNLASDIPLLSSSYTEELQALDRTFHAMLLKLNQSIGFEMKAYMAALQSQMNPHFLYNMLSAIAESADEDGSPRTVRMCEKLSSMLRYMADYSSEQVSLREDIANMRNYLDLMKVRYEELFDYDILACEGAGRPARAAHDAAAAGGELFPARLQEQAAAVAHRSALCLRGRKVAHRGARQRLRRQR